MSLKASRTPSKINDISTVLDGVDNDINDNDNGNDNERELCLKFDWNLMSLKHRVRPESQARCGCLPYIDNHATLASQTNAGKNSTHPD